jgi:hypothetical protein
MHIGKECGITAPKSIYGKHIESRSKNHKHHSRNSELLKNAYLASL